MKKITLLTCIIFFATILVAQENPDSDKKTLEETYPSPGIAIFGELGGKGYGSGNIEFPIYKNHRLSVGITVMDYDFDPNVDWYDEEKEYLSPGVMYYYLWGKKRSFFELGAGISIYPRLNSDNYADDGPVTLHGVIGYRYQKKDGLLFRAGFTPFQRINNWFLPLVGVSLGYSW